MEKTCAGCIHKGCEDAGRGYVFITCSLGKFDRPKAVLEHVPKERKGRVSVERPAWCKLGKSSA